MKVQFAKENLLYIEWEYSKKKNNKTTTCRVVEKVREREYVTLSTGVAKCHKDDKFNKELSRKLSLERALDVNNRLGTNMVIKECRQAIWNKYWSTQTNKMNRLRQ